MDNVARAPFSVAEMPPVLVTLPEIEPESPPEKEPLIVPFAEMDTEKDPPKGEPLQVPPHVPATDPWKFKVKVAVTALFAFIVTVQEPVPAQAPDHPVKVEPAAGVAVRVTEVALA